MSRLPALTALSMLVMLLYLYMSPAVNILGAAIISLLAYASVLFFAGVFVPGRFP